ncbi:hypothetical protein DRJ25_01890 [Candidatus Woesearchaeota archaeon]|nr:MAG: hypothetical protein DRJ25_01890 [Candidatus Woesearchaeota archaeon]
MGVLGLKFNKLSVERLNPPKGKISVNHNISVIDVNTVDLFLGTAKQTVLEVSFKFTADYDPKIANITVEGSLTYFDKPDKVKECVEKWKKEKKMPDEVLNVVLNQIVTKSNIEALILAREVNLPPPIQLPKVSVKQK